MKLWESPLRSVRMAALVAAAVAALTYGNSLLNGFAYDDLHAIVENEVVHDISKLPEAVSRPYWTNESGRELGIWRPATTALFTLEWELWGYNPMPYHAVNVAGHAGATALGTLVLAQLLPVGAAFLGGLIFAVHPVHVEAVSNVVGVAEILSALFLLGACLLFLRRREEGLGVAAVAGIAALYAMAFLAKENGVVLPGLLFLIDAWKDRLRLGDLWGYVKRRLPLYAALAGVAAVILGLRHLVLGSVASPHPPLGADLLEEIPRIWTVPLIWVHYVRLLFFPADLIPDYSPSVIDIQIGWGVVNATGVVLALAFLGLAWAVWRQGPLASLPGSSGGGGRGDTDSATDPGRFDDGAGPERVPRPDPETMGAITLGILWFGVAISPVANVVFLSGVLLAERTLYVPSLGFALAAGAVLWILRERSTWLAYGVVAVAVLLMAGRAWTATPMWKSNQALFNHLLDTHPEAGRIQWLLGDHFFDERDQPDRALDLYRLAVGISGTSYPLMAGISRRLMRLGAYEQAGNLARFMWRDEPGLPLAPARLALARANQGRWEEVIEAGRAALELDDEEENPVLHHVLARAYRSTGRPEDALRHRRASVEEGEADQWMQWRWLAELQVETGDTAGALASLDSARLRTGVSRARRALDSLETAWRDAGAEPPNPAPGAGSGARERSGPEGDGGL